VEERIFRRNGGRRETKRSAACAEAEKTLKEAQVERDRILAGLEREIVELIVKVARKVVSCELKTNREVIAKLIEEALVASSNKGNAVVRVSAEDGEYLEKNREELFSSIPGADEIQIKPDNSLSPGDCIVETSFGSIDAGASTKMNKIEEAFMDQVAGLATSE
jgi:flagellar assembly protein FliH